MIHVYVGMLIPTPTIMWAVPCQSSEHTMYGFFLIGENSQRTTGDEHQEDGRTALPDDPQINCRQAEERTATARHLPRVRLSQHSVQRHCQFHADVFTTESHGRCVCPQLHVHGL